MNHYCRLTSLHMKTDRAFDRQDAVKLLGLRYEHEVVRPKAKGESGTRCTR